MEYVYNVSIVCGLIKTYIFSQGIFHKKRIPAGSHEENDALLERFVQGTVIQCPRRLLFKGYQPEYSHK